jgi:hypothetical protein
MLLFLVFAVASATPTPTGGPFDDTNTNDRVAAFIAPDFAVQVHHAHTRDHVTMEHCLLHDMHHFTWCMLWFGQCYTYVHMIGTCAVC